MFFMAKSALCIGVVVALAASASGRDDMRTSLEAGGRAAAASLGQACLASAGCVNAGMRLASTVAGEDGAGLEAPLREAPARVSARLPTRTEADPSAAGAPKPASRTGDRHSRRKVAARE